MLLFGQVAVTMNFAWYRAFDKIICMKCDKFLLVVLLVTYILVIDWLRAE